MTPEQNTDCQEAVYYLQCEDTKSRRGPFPVTHRPCPSCPDGYVWTANGPTAKCCPICNGHAVVNLDGSPVGGKP